LSGEYLLVLTTCGNAADASEMAKALVTRRLAACVNRLEGVVSTYRWESAVHEDSEVLLLIKTTAGRLGQVEASIKELSSYELPEIVAVPIQSGSRDYLEWLAASVGPEE
jgi:periplasmic divalent cation tolerance protein